ncbi:MAG: hypothetical protein GF329_01970, partial [Candidatus Lokiarchaeota archaeon]|nr:hypothetical protein [Candidatus Lokiarchaeota archaeon]
MRASLRSRKSVRLKWFEVKDINFQIKRKLEVSYSINTVENNVNTHTPKMEYIFKDVNNKNIPSSDIIIFENELPATYARTSGSKGNKFTTDPEIDPVVRVIDRIVELKKGKENISREPPEYPDMRIKEIEIREREDSLKRKLTFKNETDDKIEYLEFKFMETKNVRFVNSNPEPINRDPPEYK